MSRNRDERTAHLASNLCALWKKQTTLPSLASAGIPQQMEALNSLTRFHHRFTVGSMTISVFTRDRDGALRHVYSAHPWIAEDVKERGIDWYAKLTYPPR